MTPDYGFYKATYLTATGYLAITSGPSVIGSIVVQASSTGGFELFTTSTATASTAITGVVRAFSTTAATTQGAVNFPLQIDCPTGFCIRVSPSLDPKLTLFWRPVGGV